MVGTGLKTRKSKASNKLATKGYVNKQIHQNIENKYVIIYPSVTFASIGSAWTESNICLPTQGDTLLSRTGSTISIRSLEIKMVIQTGADELATDDGSNVVRCIIGRYGGSNNTPLTSAGTGINDPVTREISTSANLIKKYFDKYIPLMVTSTEKGAGDGYTPQLKLISYYKKFKKPIRITFGDNGVGLPSTRLIVSMISDSGAVTNPGIINGYIKTMFEDT